VNNLIYDSNLDQKQKDLFVTLIASTNNLVEAVNRIVNVSTPDLLKLKERLVSFNLAHALFSIRKLFSERPNLVFEIQVSQNIQNNLIGDPVLIKQILLNLMQNLLFPVPSNLTQSVIVKVIPEQETKAEMDISFNISTFYTDHEPGSKRTVIPFLASADFTNTIRLIEFAGGSLNIRSEEDITEYNYILNFQKDLNRKIETIAEKVPVKETKPVDIKDAIVLLVEDNIINQKIVMLSLKSMVKNIEVANNGKEALDKFGTSKYDIILMDVQMPVMNGIIAAKKIREIESSTNTQTPIIAITANALAGHRESCLAVGMNDYISKPFEVEILIQKMKNLLEKK
jgi:CheY-like chemotaxis protein